MTEAAPPPPPVATLDREDGTVQPTMTDLRDHYVRRANEAVAADRVELIRELDEEYVEEALRLILASA